jgi:uncharacterized protein YigA (DUF484 family)
VKPATAPLLDPDPMAEAVADYLAAHPDFLARRPALYRALTPPRRVHGENLADHMVAMVAAERARLRAYEAELQEAVQDGRAGAGLITRVRLAVLALMRARDIPDCVAQELPALLRVDSATLLIEPRDTRLGRLPPGLWPMPAGTVARLLGNGRDARVRGAVTDAELLHGEAAGLVVRDALAKVPLGCGTPCLIALGARDAAALPLRQSGQTLAFLGRVVGAALGR